MEVAVFFPAVDHDALSDGLRSLTEAISRLDEDTVAHGFLGGEFGYGAQFDNSTFEMRPYYWGDCDCGWSEKEAEWCDKHSHKIDCYLSVARKRIEHKGLRREVERAVKARERHPFCSPQYDRAQEKVEAASKAERAAEMQIYKDLCEQHGIPWNDGLGCAVHCTCGHDKEWQAFFDKQGGHKPTCSLTLPNFRHKPSGFEVRWYKYIGRDMEMVGTMPALVIEECIASLAVPS